MPVIEQKTTNKNKVDFDLNRLDKSKTTIFSKYPLYHGEPPMKEDRRPQEICVIWIDHTNRIISFRKEDGAL